MQKTVKKYCLHFIIVFFFRKIGIDLCSGVFCNPDALCEEGNCICQPGFEGDGEVCERKCIVFQVTHKFIIVTIRQDGVVVKDIAVRATGFDSSPGEIGHNVANGSPPLQRFLEVVLPRR